MTTPDVHLAVGAHALHALPDDERAEFREHLDECDSCARELAEFRATLAMVAELAAERPPASLRERVLAIPATTRQFPPLAPAPTGTPGTAEPDTAELGTAEPGTAEPGTAGPDATGGSGRGGNSADSTHTADSADTAGTADSTVVPLRRPWYRRPVSWLAAAVVALAVAGGLTAVLRQPSPDATEQAAACVRTATDRSEHRAATGTGTVLSATSCGAATVDLSGLAALPSDRSYQLWIMTGDTPRPAGLVSVAGNGTAAPVVTGLTTADTAIALTVEPAGGSPQPTSTPIWVTPIR